MGDVLSLRTDGGILTKADKGWVKAVLEEGEGKKVQHRYLFCIEDPFELSHNVARTVTHNGIVAIRDEFRRAKRILQAVGNGQTPHDGELLAQLVEEEPLADALEAVRIADPNDAAVTNAAPAQSDQPTRANGEGRPARPARNKSTQQQQNGAAKTAAVPSKQLDVKDNDAFPSLGGSAKSKPAKNKREPLVADESEISGERAKEYLEEVKRKKAEASAEQTATNAAESVLGGDD